ncbi:MAG: DNA recombination protein RmuC [Ruminococcus flavefaciens]|nr:DNA recombination protein RmuC [Ruminococcus flavefaciens]MCM1230346.1 DNA recombination protein RmuC [Ruminococcus flavefaciens]
MEIIILICCVAIIIMLALIIAMLLKSADRKSGNNSKEIAELRKQLDFLSKNNAENNKLLLEQSARQSETLVRQISVLGDSLRSSVNLQQENQHNDMNEKLARLESDFDKVGENILGSLENIRRSNSESMEKMRAENQESLDRISNSMNVQQEKLHGNINEKLSKLEGDFDKVGENILGSLENIRRSNSESMEKMRAENQESLDRINNTVSDKLQKSLDDRISKSFEAVNKRLAEVYEGLGEMKSVASGVSDLKNVLSNVKTRGILGEIQLGAILSEILAPEQYGEQVAVAPRSSEKVDFAVKLPGTDDDCVYLPIDSKFPGDTYSNLLEAYESGNPELLKSKRTLLINEIKRCAKSIHDKYIRPPYTTDFAIMFLPFEGLYAEVVNLGLVELLQREYRINIAGPSTMGAMLNSLQMGFRTLAIQKKSGEVWTILESAKKEFGKFEEVLNKTRDRLRQADDELGKLIGTRTNQINSALKKVTLTDGDNLPD